jgi:hypothetical protein
LVGGEKVVFLLLAARIKRTASRMGTPSAGRQKEKPAPFDTGFSQRRMEH